MPPHVDHWQVLAFASTMIQKETILWWKTSHFSCLKMKAAECFREMRLAWWWAVGGTRGWRRRGGVNRAGAGKTLPGGGTKYDEGLWWRRSLQLWPYRWQESLVPKGQPWVDGASSLPPKEKRNESATSSSSCLCFPLRSDLVPSFIP